VKRFREAINFLCEWNISQKFGYKFAFEAKPNEPRGHMYFAVTGSYLALIPTLDHPEMCGVNPEVAHEHMAGLNFVHHVAQALEMGKLFHIDLNDQEFGRYDQDFRFGQANLKHAFFLVKLLEDYKYNGSRHFDATPAHSDLQRREGVRAGLHADVHDPQGKGRPLERGQGDPGAAEDHQPGRCALEADEEVQRREREEAAGRAAEPRGTRKRAVAV
jgi:xylose isomerase